MLEPKNELVKDVENKVEHPENMSLMDWLMKMENPEEMNGIDILYVKLYFIRKNGERYGWMTIVENIRSIAPGIKVGGIIGRRLESDLTVDGTRIYGPKLAKHARRMEATKVKTIYTDDVLEGDPGWAIGKKARRFDLLLEVP